MTYQPYPRDADGLLKLDLLPEGKTRISEVILRDAISDAIHKANKKSSRDPVLDELNTGAERANQTAAKRLFALFRNYSADPAEASVHILGRTPYDIVTEIYRSLLEKRLRMNAGWRYQFLAEELASKSERFERVSGLGTREDFTVIVRLKNGSEVNVYVSVKNRRDTISGKDYPAVITRMEAEPSNDRNRVGPYLIVIALAIHPGKNRSRMRNKDKQLISENFELWPANFFWPFVAGVSYETIMAAVASQIKRVALPSLPVEVSDYFEQLCREAGLLQDGAFHDQGALLKLFCRS